MLHQIQAGTILHYLLRLLLPPIFTQKLRWSIVCSGIINIWLIRFVNRDHTCVVTLQWRNKWLFVSRASLQRYHLVAIIFALFWSLSCVRQPFLVTNHMKHFTLVWSTQFHIALQGPDFFSTIVARSLLYILFTMNWPWLWCPITIYLFLDLFKENLQSKLAYTLPTLFPNHSEIS